MNIKLNRAHLLCICHAPDGFNNMPNCINTLFYLLNTASYHLKTFSNKSPGRPGTIRKV